MTSEYGARPLFHWNALTWEAHSGWGHILAGALVLPGLVPGGCSQVKASPGSAVTWPLPRACHHWKSPSSIQLSTLPMDREIIVGETVRLERNLFLLSMCCKIISAGYFFFFLVFLFFFFPFLISSDFHRGRSLLTETSTPPPGKSKEPCSSSLLLVGPTFDGLTPNLHFREWLEYTFSWSSGRYFCRCPELGAGGSKTKQNQKQNKSHPGI